MGCVVNSFKSNKRICLGKEKKFTKSHPMDKLPVKGIVVSLSLTRPVGKPTDLATLPTTL